MKSMFHGAIITGNCEFAEFLGISSYLILGSNI